VVFHAAMRAAVCCACATNLMVSGCWGEVFLRVNCLAGVTRGMWKGSVLLMGGTNTSHQHCDAGIPHQLRPGLQVASAHLGGGTECTH
jgi:hypothetical protein